MLGRPRAARPRLRPPCVRHARVGRPLLRPRASAVADPAAEALLAELVADNARHMLLFRERAAGPRRRPRRLRLPARGRGDLRAHRRARRSRSSLGYALGSLDHFAELLTVYAGGGRRGRRRGDRRRCAPTSTRERAALRDALVRGGAAPLAAEAHERYRVRELVETPALRACRLSPRRPLPASPSCSATCCRSALRAPGASRRWRSPRAPARCVSDGLRIGYAHGFDSGPFMAHVYADRPAGRTALGRARSTAACCAARTCLAFRDIRGLAERAVREALDAHPGRGARGRRPGRRPGAVPAARDRRRPRRTRAPVRHRPRRARPGARSGASASASRTACVRARRRLRPRRAGPLAPRPDVVLELGLYGIYHDDALIERHFRGPRRAGRAGARSSSTSRPRNPEIEYIARVWRNAAGERCVWRLRPARAAPRLGRRCRLPARVGHRGPLSGSTASSRLGAPGAEARMTQRPHLDRAPTWATRSARAPSACARCSAATTRCGTT